MTMTTMGITIFLAFGTTPVFMATEVNSSETIGCAPSGNTLPSSRARRSAFAIGPKSLPVKMITKTSSSAKIG